MKKNISFLSILILLISCSTPKLDISQIEFQAGPCFGECPIFNITIASDGTTNYNAERHNEEQGQFNTIIKKPQLDSLIKALESSNFFNLNNEYSVEMTDHPTYMITVKLKDGRSKTIEDYGPGGPEKLKSVYRIIFSLRQSQDWR